VGDVEVTWVIFSVCLAWAVVVALDKKKLKKEKASEKNLKFH
jgi:hypothetical protein